MGRRTIILDYMEEGKVAVKVLQDLGLTILFVRLQPPPKTDEGSHASSVVS